MQKIVTKDGSVTFHNEQYDEAYHSKSGAKEEALKKFAEQCNIKELAKTGSICILDICFGLGYNAAAAIDVALEEDPNCSIEITGLENDEAILNEILSLDNPFNYYNIIKETIKNNANSPLTSIPIAASCGVLLARSSVNSRNCEIGSLQAHGYSTQFHNKIKNSYFYNKNNIKIEILFGDARKTIKTLAHKSHHEYDAVFLDPFSPKKCPELWTAEFFSDIAALIKHNRKLATYSCARIVRDNLKEAGFTVFDGLMLWRRGPSTVAVKMQQNETY